MSRVGEVTIRLMLVDDHEILRQGLKFMLSTERDLVVVAEAGDGAEALRIVEGARPDVMLLDVKMPTMDGLQTLRLLRDACPALPVLILTVHDDPEYVEEALRAGATGYLLKSVSREELTRAIRAAAAGSGYLQAEITKPVLERFARGSTPIAAVHLSPREREVARLLADGLSNKQIARRLGISEATVKGYLSQMFEKLGATDRAHAVALALRSRLIE